MIGFFSQRGSCTTLLSLFFQLSGSADAVAAAGYLRTTGEALAAVAPPPFLPDSLFDISSPLSTILASWPLLFLLLNPFAFSPVVVQR